MILSIGASNWRTAFSTWLVRIRGRFNTERRTAACEKPLDRTSIQGRLLITGWHAIQNIDKPASIFEVPISSATTYENDLIKWVELRVSGRDLQRARIIMISRWISSCSGNPSVVPITRWAPGFQTNTKIFSYGVYGEYDRRNDDQGLTKGFYLYGRFASADGLNYDNNPVFQDYGWLETELDARGYVPLFSDRTSLAVRAYSDLKSPKGGSQIPFYDLAIVGGRSYVRGFPDYRFRGNNSLLFSGELRQTVWRRTENQGLDVFGFADVGQVWGDNRSKTNPAVIQNDDFDSRNWRTGAGRWRPIPDIEELRRSRRTRT